MPEASGACAVDIAMGCLLLLAGAALVLAGAQQGMVVLFDVRPYLPPQFREEVAARFAVDTYVWDRSVPISVRRRYFRSMVFASIGMVFIFLAMLIFDQTGPAIGFGIVSALGVALTTSRWLQYRDRL